MDNNYKCTKCDMLFNSSRALGGHMSSHNRGNSYRLKRQTEKSKLRRIKSNGPHLCKYCNAEYDSGVKLGGHVTLCNMNPNRNKTLNKISKSAKRQTLSKEVRSKISESMKVAHKEGRAWNIGMSRWNNEPSYPESFFMKVIENEFIDKNYKTEYPISIYSFDFAWVDQKKAIEIDGSQHDRFDEIKERDNKKDMLAKKMGWQVLRIKWIDMFNNTQEYIKKAYEFIH